MQETRTSDIYCLDLESWTWSEMYVKWWRNFNFCFVFVCFAWKCICYKACLFSLVRFWQFWFGQYCNILSRIPVSSTPVGRSWHTLTAVSDSTLFLFGGLSVDCKPMSEKMHQLTYISSFQLIFFMFLTIFFSFNKYSIFFIRWWVVAWCWNKELERSRASL